MSVIKPIRTRMTGYAVAVLSLGIAVFAWATPQETTMRDPGVVLPAPKMTVGIADDFNVEEPKNSHPGYLGSEACKECHQDEYRDWIASDHRMAMQPARSDTVEGDFDNARFTSHEITRTFTRSGGAYYITEKDKDGKETRYQVSYTFGVRPLQQYLIGFPDGRHQAYTVAWDANEKKWFDLYPDEKIGQNDELSWLRHNFTWNLNCADCHSTDLKRNYNLKTNTYYTNYAEVSVGCEACHGPGQEHVKIAKETNNEFPIDSRMGLKVWYKNAPFNTTEIDTCAPCHSRRQEIALRNGSAHDLLDRYAPELLESDLYFADGSIKDEVFVYGSFLQSRMFRENVKCSNCHLPHSGRIKFAGNALCLQCHEASTYDVESHTHHPKDSSGTACMECHMPNRTYMVVDPRRDHYIRIPRPDLTVKYGIPNACNHCHAKPEEPAQWAVDKVEEWFGTRRILLATSADAFAAARQGDTKAIEELKRIASDNIEYGPMTRATAASLLGRFGSENGVVKFLGRLLHDGDYLVRMGAARGLGSTPTDKRPEALGQALGDELLAVRIEAAKGLAPLGKSMIPAHIKTAFKRAIAEYETSLRTFSDSPDAELNLGVLMSQLGEPEKSAQAYKDALRIDDTYVPAMVNLAMELYSAGDSAKAEELFRRAITCRPDFAQGYFMLALLVGENPNRLDEVVTLLAKADERAPGRADIEYNLGAVLQRIGNLDVAEKHYRRAMVIQPSSIEYLTTHLQIALKLERWKDALDDVERLIKLQPNHSIWPRYREVIKSHLR